MHFIVAAFLLAYGAALDCPWGDALSCSHSCPAGDQDVYILCIQACSFRCNKNESGPARRRLNVVNSKSAAAKSQCMVDMLNSCNQEMVSVRTEIAELRVWVSEFNVANSKLLEKLKKCPRELPFAFLPGSAARSPKVANVLTTGTRVDTECQSCCQVGFTEGQQGGKRPVSYTCSDQDFEWIPDVGIPPQCSQVLVNCVRPENNSDITISASSSHGSDVHVNNGKKQWAGTHSDQWLTDGNSKVGSWITFDLGSDYAKWDVQRVDLWGQNQNHCGSGCRDASEASLWGSDNAQDPNSGIMVKIFTMSGLSHYSSGSNQVQPFDISNTARRTYRYWSIRTDAFHSSDGYVGFMEIELWANKIA